MEGLSSIPAPVPAGACVSLSKVDRPIAEATGLPNFAYTTDWFFAIEREAVFKPRWCCVAFASDVPEIGDVRPFEFMGLPLLLVRAEDGIRVFHNVCSHRGATLVEAACKVKGALRCPYHSWAYDLHGRLRATPAIGGPKTNSLSGFVRADHDLKEVRSAVWHDLIFLNLSGEAPSFEDFMRPLESRWRPYDLSLFHKPNRGSNIELRIAANWKLAVENTSESYHLPWVHPGLNSASSIDDHYHIVGGDSYCGQGTHSYAYRPVSDQIPPRLPGLPAEVAAQAEYITLFPNVQIGLHSDQLFHIMIIPVSPDCTIERIGFYYADPAANSPEFEAFREQNIAWWRNVFSEDMGIIERLQRGRASAAFQGGCFSPVMDVPTHHFHRWVARLTAGAMGAAGSA